MMSQRHSLRRVTTYIYALSDPRTGAVRYVGSAIDPAARFKAHCRPVIFSSAKGMVQWVIELTTHDLDPVMSIIDEVPPGGDWHARERQLIADHLAAGCDLLNAVDGGTFRPERRPSRQTREYWPVSVRFNEVEWIALGHFERASGFSQEYLIRYALHHLDLRGCRHAPPLPELPSVPVPKATLSDAGTADVWTELSGRLGLTRAGVFKLAARVLTEVLDRGVDVAASQLPQEPADAQPDSPDE